MATFVLKRRLHVRTRDLHVASRIQLFFPYAVWIVSTQGALCCGFAFFGPTVDSMDLIWVGRYSVLSASDSQMD